jgi:hypothetical protein
MQFGDHPSDLLIVLLNMTLQQVMIKLYKEHNLEAFFQFSGAGTDRLNWLSRNNLMNSSYSDLPGSELHYGMIR